MAVGTGVSRAAQRLRANDDISKAERLCNGGYDQVKVADRSKLYQADAMSKHTDQIGRDFLSQACLTDAARAGEREEPNPRP